MGLYPVSTPLYVKFIEALMTPIGPTFLSLASGVSPQTRFGRGPTDAEMAELKAYCHKKNLDTDRLEPLTVRVLENPDKTMSKWTYRFTGFFMDWIRNVWGYLKHWSDEKKPFDIHWAKFDNETDAGGWYSDWKDAAKGKNKEFKDDKAPVKFEIHDEAPDKKSVLRILIHDPAFKEQGKDSPQKS